MTMHKVKETRCGNSFPCYVTVRASLQNERKIPTEAQHLGFLYLSKKSIESDSIEGKIALSCKNMKLYNSFLDLSMGERCFPTQDMISLWTCLGVCSGTSYSDFYTFEHSPDPLNGAYAPTHFSKV